MFPFAAVVAVLSAGGAIVPHSAGGLIAINAAGAYVAGTYMSTAALSGFLLGTAAIGATGAVALSAGAIVSLKGAIIGSAGWFGTAYGATGLTGLLMSVGLISGVPVMVPILIVLMLLLILTTGIWRYVRLRRLRRRVLACKPEQEVFFTQQEAALIEKLVRRMAKVKHSFFASLFRWRPKSSDT